jgi:hypothetical protein
LQALCIDTGRYYCGFLTNQATIYGTSPTGVIVTDLSDDDSELEDDPTVIVIEGCTMKVI